MLEKREPAVDYGWLQTQAQAAPCSVPRVNLPREIQPTQGESYDPEPLKVQSHI